MMTENIPMDAKELLALHADRDVVEHAIAFGENDLLTHSGLTDSGRRDAQVLVNLAKLYIQDRAYQSLLEHQRELDTEIQRLRAGVERAMGLYLQGHTEAGGAMDLYDELDKLATWTETR